MSRPGETTVVLATRDGARFLREQLDSLAGQRRLPARLVVTDDRSTDATLDVVRAFAAQAPFPVDITVNHEVLGPSDNFLEALGSATSRYVAWCDQDDVWHENKLLWCERILDNLAVTMVIHGARRVDAARRSLGRLGGTRFPPLQPRLGANRFLVPHGFRQVFRATLVDSIDWRTRPASAGDHPAMLHDEWTYSLANAAGPILWLPLSLAEYRVHGDNLSGAERQTNPVAHALRAEDSDATKTRICAERAVHLRSCGEGAYRSAFRASADAYEQMAREYAARSERLGATGTTRRLAAIVRATRGGSHRAPRSGGLGARSLARELTAVARRRSG